MNNISKWIVAWLEKNGDVDAIDITQNMDENYFTAGYIDSFKFINMISDIEESFGIEFDNSQFEDRNFTTVNGLSKIIREMKNIK